MKLAELQARFADKHEKARSYAHELSYKYGQTWQAPSGMRTRLDKLRAAEDKAMEAVFAWLDAHSPRNWRVGVPAHWVCEHLTETDALTAGQLVTVPPAGYGTTYDQAIRFAAPVA